MKFTITILVVATSVCLTLHSQDKKEAASSKDSPKAEQKLQLVKVASLNTIQANQEFQKNVQLVQQQRALAVQLLSKIQSEQDEEKHKELKKQLDALQGKLNENNKLMFKTYGFTLNRNYVLTVEKAHVHMWVTAEEAVAIQARSGAKGAEESKNDPKKDDKKPSGLRGLFNKRK